VSLIDVMKRGDVKGERAYFNLSNIAYVRTRGRAAILLSLCVCLLLCGTNRWQSPSSGTAIAVLQGLLHGPELSKSIASVLKARIAENVSLEERRWVIFKERLGSRLFH
jgi:hypothetical protein